MELLIIIAVLAVIVGVSAGLVVRRRRTRTGLEPPPEAPRLTPSIRADVEDQRAQMLERIEERERLEREAAERLAEGKGGAEAPTPPVEVPDALAAAVEEALAPADADVEVVEPPVEAPPKPRFRDRLGKARDKLSGVFGSLRKAKIDDETWDDLEAALIGADVGVEATTDLIEHLQGRVKAEGLTDGEQLLDALKDEMKLRLTTVSARDLAFAPEAPTVWLFVGVNGVGKTTTIGKLGKREIDDGRTVVMAAGDTFRAAAAEQLQMWADRCGAECVRGNEGGDPSAVIFDAIESAAARGADLVLADTAGRLHTKVNLMEELRKVRRVADKGAGTVTEVLLVLDATTGQNGLVQAQQFTEAVEITGVVLTKLDGSAKGGIVFAIQQNLGIPVKLVGLGESAEDLVPFDVDEFVDALFA
ncbi:MAG: signal recognition particle-docking protein FtsY [Acidimicrobiales bacterium]